MTTQNEFIDTVRKIGPSLAERAAACDVEGRFVSENYEIMKRAKLFSAGVPSELGGGGASHGTLCQIIREVAHYCGSSALALSMHTHLVAAAVWRHKHGQPAEALLRKIAAGELVLVSTGAGDWLDSVGRAERVEGGYRVNAVKRFCSGAPAGDILMTSAPFGDPKTEVLHFPVPMKAPGVTLLNDWDTLGMRGTGSCSIELKDVFVPEEAIGVRRPHGLWHGSWNVVCTVAPAIFMGAYVGVAERATTIAREAARAKTPDAFGMQALGELENNNVLMQMAFREMVELACDYDFEPTAERASQCLIRKTLATKALLATVDSAIEVVGGSALFRKVGLERLLRDVKGAPFHPLPEKKQLSFTARVSLGLSPV